jgi:hypothetical protein
LIARIFSGLYQLITDCPDNSLFAFDCQSAGTRNAGCRSQWQLIADGWDGARQPVPELVRAPVIRVTF